MRVMKAAVPPSLRVGGEIKEEYLWEVCEFVTWPAGTVGGLVPAGRAKMVVVMRERKSRKRKRVVGERMRENDLCILHLEVFLLS